VLTSVEGRRVGDLPSTEGNNSSKGDAEMNKKMLVTALALSASLLVTANAFGQTGACSTGVNIVFNGVGSSAQANSLAQAARALTQNGSGNYNLVSTSAGAVVTDHRPTIGGVQGVNDSANPFWVIWDFGTTCNVYAYWTVDSGVGVKDFLAYEKFTNSSAKVYNSLAAAYGTITESSITASTENQVGGLPDTQDSEVGVSGSPFDLIVQALNIQPRTRVATGNVQAPKYCGNLTTTSTAALTQFQCYFNAGATDIRPEDALYATTRALTSYTGLDIALNGTHNSETKVGTGQLTGLGYDTATANSTTCTPGATFGCTILDSFGQGKKFNVVTFKLSGADPIGGGTLPGYTTLSTGAAPELVIVHNGSDFGTTAGGTYVYNDIQKQVLAQIFSGWTHCTHDLLTTSASFLTPGNPIQVVQREPLSGTYNTFEFNAVRTLAGSSNPLTNINATAPGPPISNAYDGQEQFNDPNQLPGGNGTACTENSKGVPQANCFNPLFFTNPVNECPGTAGSNIPVRLRAIGTGEEVKATVATYNTVGGVSSGAAQVNNSIGYAFWGYGNLDPLCSATGGTTTCPGSYIGHYLTVDGIDPLFTTEGGQFDTTPNPAGAFNPPYCNVTGVSQTCFAIPFTHVKDGKYPIWSLLRIVTLAPKAGSVATPIGVLNMVAEEEITTATDGLSDFVPFLTNLSGSTATGIWTGDLNLFVFREHYKQSAVNPVNGHSGCNVSGQSSQNFTGIQLQGGAHGGPAACLVDFGGDVGGSVITVQKDVDFITDFGTEEFAQHQ
jgi:hypothetical protein